jgi:hypothetical protein
LRAGGICAGRCPGPATAFLWTASRRSYGKRGNRLGPAGLCQRSIYSSWQIAKRRIRTSASVTRRHRKRLSHLRSRARSQGLRPRKCRRRSSVTRRHRKQSSHPRAHPTQSRLPRKRRQPRRAIRLASAKSDLVPVFEKKNDTCRRPCHITRHDNARFGKLPAREGFLTLYKRLAFQLGRQARPAGPR